jgi:hypothetical protein
MQKVQITLVIKIKTLNLINILMNNLLINKILKFKINFNKTIIRVAFNSNYIKVIKILIELN